MSTQVTLELPDETYRRMEYFAHLTGRDVYAVLADAIERALSPLGNAADAAEPIQELPDADVLRLAESRMAPAQDRRLSALLYRRQAGRLSNPQQHELQALMQAYQEGLLRKAQALREAVRRGLLAPLTP